MDSAPSPTSRLSVVIPVHNRADLAAQCLAALARWTTPLEILVVDDGSTDPGVPLLHRTGLGEQDGHAWRWLRNPEARGFSAAINRGLAEATGDLLLLLNSDAEVTEGGDHRIRDAFTEDRRQGGQLGALAARLVYPNGLPQWSGGAFPTHLWLFALASGLGRGARFRVRKGPPSGFTGGTVDWAPGAALAISREAFETVGPFDESYRHYAQDLDYCQRLARAGRKVRVLADWIVVHHLGGSVGQIGDLASAHPSEPQSLSANPPVAAPSAATPAAGSGNGGLRRPAPRPALARPPALGAPPPRRALGAPGAPRPAARRPTAPAPAGEAARHARSARGPCRDRRDHRDRRAA